MPATRTQRGHRAGHSDDEPTALSRPMMTRRSRSRSAAGDHRREDGEPDAREREQRRCARHVHGHGHERSVEPVTLTTLDDECSAISRTTRTRRSRTARVTCLQELDAAGGEGDSYTCTFDALITGSSGGDPHVNTVTATAHDDEDNEATDEDDATVTFDDVPSTITVTKTANPTVGAGQRPRSRSRSSSGTTRRSTPSTSRR